MKILTKSDHSDIYEDNDEIHGHIIIKTLGERKDSGWINRQKHGYDIINKLKKTYSSSELGVNLPELISINENDEIPSISEKFISGESFSHTIYNSLKTREKRELAKQIALFLNALHQLEKPKQPIDSIKVVWEKEKVMEKINSLPKIVDAFKDKLSKQTQKTVSDAEQYLKEKSIKDELQVLTHRDLHCKNLIYNKDINKLTIIDFELAREDNIYRDFIPYMTTAALPWDLLKQIVKYYNDIPDKKYPISIDIEKVKNTIIYGVTRINARNIDLHFKGDVDFAAKRLEAFLENYFVHKKEKFNTGKNKVKKPNVYQKTNSQSR